MRSDTDLGQVDLADNPHQFILKLFVRDKIRALCGLLREASHFMLAQYTCGFCAG